MAKASAGVNTSQNVGPYYVGDTVHLACVAYGGKAVTFCSTFVATRGPCRIIIFLPIYTLPFTPCSLYPYTILLRLDSRRILPFSPVRSRCIIFSFFFDFLTNTIHPSFSWPSVPLHPTHLLQPVLCRRPILISSFFSAVCLIS